MIGEFLGVAFHLVFYFLAWLLPFSLILLGLGLWRRKRSIALVGASLVLLGLAHVPISLYQRGLGVDAAITLLGAYAHGYQYDPSTEAPDSTLIPSPPEVLIQRQLDALVGRTGPAPLRSDTALVGYELEQVRVTGWLSKYPVAEVTTQLRFADGRQQSEQFELVAGGGAILALPWFGETTWQITGWRSGPLTELFQEPAPATPLSTSPPPVELRSVASIEAGAPEQGGGSVDIAVPSDIASDGRLLFDRDIRTGEGRRNHNQMMLRHPDGELEQLAQTYLSARGKFSPDGRRVLYVRGRQRKSLHLAVLDAGGNVTDIAEVAWMSHHWVDDNQIAYSADGQVQLYSLADGTRRSLAPLPPESLIRSRYFRVAPDGRHLAYSDTEGRLWLLTVDSGVVQTFGWDVSELSWGSGMAWDAAGERLAYSAFNRTTLPDQAEVWVRPIESDTATLLARTAPGFLEDSRVNFGKLCWADDQTVLFAAHRLNRRDVRLLAAAADGSGLWDVTPAGLTIPFPELTCAAGYVAVPTDRTRLELLKIVSVAPSSRSATAAPTLTPLPLPTATSASRDTSAPEHRAVNGKPLAPTVTEAPATPLPSPSPTLTAQQVRRIPSPDGQWTALLNETADSLDLQGPDGEVIPVFPADSTVNSATWSPDSRHLLVVRANWQRPQPGGPVEVSGPVEIWRVRLESRRVGPAELVFRVNHVLVVLDRTRGFILRGRGDGRVFDAVAASLRLR